MSKLPAIEWGEPVAKGGADALDVKIDFAVPEFFSTDPRKLEVEDNVGAGRVYILKNGRIIAVAKPRNGETFHDQSGRHLRHRER